MQACRVLNHVTWQPLLEAAHTDTVKGPATLVVYQEVEEAGPSSSSANTPGGAPHLRSPSNAGLKETKSKYVIADLPAAVPNVRPALDKPWPKLGVGE